MRVSHKIILGVLFTGLTIKQALPVKIGKPSPQVEEELRKVSKKEG